MAKQKLPVVLGFLTAFIFLLTALTRSEGRAAYLALAVVFFIFAVARKRAQTPGE